MGLVVRATRTAPLGKAAKSSMLRTRKTGPWAWPGLPARPERTGDEVEEVEEADAGEGEVASAAPGVAETSWEEQAPVSSGVMTS